MAIISIISFIIFGFVSWYLAQMVQQQIEKRVARKNKRFAEIECDASGFALPSREKVKNGICTNVRRKYAIFVCGPHLNNPIGDYGDMIMQTLKLAHADFKKYIVYENEIPSFQEVVDNFNGIFFTGSKFDSFSNDPWTVTLRKLIAEIHDRNNQQVEDDKIIKMIGFCFGHQVIAHALRKIGGLVGRNNKGKWEIGVKQLKLTDSFSDLFGDDLGIDLKELKILKTHRDAVLSLPDNAELLAYSDKTDVEMYCIGKQVLCMQGHPEFSKTFLQQIVDNHQTDPSVPKSEIEYAVHSLKEMHPDYDALKRVILKFINM